MEACGFKYGKEICHIQLHRMYTYLQCPSIGSVIRLEYENFDTTEFPQLSQR